MTDTTDIKALSYARLIEVRNILSGFEDGYDTVADKENYEAMRDAQALIDELISARWQLVTVTTKLEAERQRADDAESKLRSEVMKSLLTTDCMRKAHRKIAEMESEQVPVVWKITTPSGSIIFHTEEQDMDGHSYYGNTVTPLFAAPQKPVISRIDFESYYSGIMGTPMSVLKVLRNGDSYSETEGERLSLAWSSYQAAIEAAGGIVKDGE